MTEILTFAARDEQPRHTLPQSKPVLRWVIDPATGRPVMAWSLRQPAADTLAA